MHSRAFYDQRYFPQILLLLGSRENTAGTTCAYQYCVHTDPFSKNFDALFVSEDAKSLLLAFHFGGVHTYIRYFLQDNPGQELRSQNLLGWKI